MPRSAKPFMYLASMLLAFYAYSMLARTLYPVLGLTEELDIYIFNKWLLLLLVGGAVLWLGSHRQVGLVAHANWKTLPLYWPMAVIAILTWAGAKGLPDGATFAKIVTFCIAVGIAEEVLFRGLVFHWFRVLPVRRIIIISAASFALIHLAVGLSSDFNPTVILGQAVLAFALGLIFAAARARDVSILIPILAHIVFDVLVISAQGGVSQTLDEESQAAAGLLLIGAMVLAWGFWLLWKAGDSRFSQEPENAAEPSSA